MPPARIVIPSATAKRRLFHKKLGQTTHGSLEEEWNEDDLLVDADAKTSGGRPIDDGERVEKGDTTDDKT